jgi:hypothetical protein
MGKISEQKSHQRRYTDMRGEEDKGEMEGMNSTMIYCELL